MNKIAGNPNFVNDERLNKKIEGVLGMNSFQKMVDNAEVFEDIQNTTLFNQSEFLQKSMNNALNSFQKLLPSHSQIREDEDPDELPRFGATEENIADNIVMLEPELDDIDKDVEKLLQQVPAKKEASGKVGKDAAKSEPKSPEVGDQPSLPINDDSFSNL